MSYLKKYEYVIAVAKHGGISQAAEHLGVSQPTFSKYLKKIEGELGVELFDRSTLPLRLTEAGKCFVEAGKRMIDVDRQLSKQLEEIRSGGSTVVRIGISPSRSQYMLPDIIALYKQRCPSVTVVIEERTTAELNKRLTEGELDLVISLLDRDTAEFERVELFDKRVMLAAPEGAVREGDDAREILSGFPLISVGRGQVMWQTLSEIVRELDLPAPEIECQSIESALALVRRGIGAMLVPSYVARGRTDGLRLLPLGGELTGERVRRVCLFYRRAQFLTAAERELIRCIVETEEKRKSEV